MADIDKGLPVRTEGDADEKVQVKVVDATTPAQQLSVLANGHAQVAIADETGTAWSAGNPLPTSPAPASGTQVADYDKATATAASATTNHDYSVANGVTFYLTEVSCSASSRGKYTLQIGDGAASEAFTETEVQFGTESNPNTKMTFNEFPVVGTVNTTTIRLIKENRDDDDAQDMYSTIKGRSD